MYLYKKILDLRHNRYLLFELFTLIFLSFIVFISAQALFHPGFFRTIDDITSIRIVYLLKELVRGDWIHNFPVRWSSELAHGYGYPLYLFYASLPYYFGALIMKVSGISHIVATKIVYVFPLIVGPYLFYFAARCRVERLAALAGACFYTLFPFRGYDTYIRGGVGEAWAMAFLPGVFLGIFLIEKKIRGGGALFSLFLAFTIFSHNISAYLIVPFVFIYGLFFHLRNKIFWMYLILGILSVSFSWLPAIYYLNLVKVSYSDQNSGQILQYFDNLSRIVGFEYPHNPHSRFNGFLFYILSGCLVTLFVKRVKIGYTRRKQFIFWISSGFILLFLLWSGFKFIWSVTLPISRLLQFTWRLLIVLSFIVPLVLSIWLSLLRKTILRILLFIIVLIAISIYIPAFKPEGYTYFYEYKAEETGLCATSWGEEYIPIWTKICAHGPNADKLFVINAQKLNIIENNGINIKAVSNNIIPYELVVNTYYFPGWKILVDGKSLPLSYTFSDLGIFKAKVPEGKHVVQVRFMKTNIMWFADFLSIIGFSFVLYFLNLSLFTLKLNYFKHK